eukprot:scaffold61761_cov60-Phaeocystis_antarctica.AAC.2
MKQIRLHCTQHKRVPTPHVGAPGARETTLPPWRLLAGLSAAGVRSRLGDAARAGHDSHGRECREHLGVGQREEHQTSRAEE